MDDVVTWIFPANEVEVTAQIIGRGAFGEVRVAKWRSIPVACKRLHAAVESDSHAQEVMDGLNAEMQILSKLRHPNLVLFLGVCVATNDDVNHPHLTSLPTMILTELMPCSLYDILEVHKVPLNLAEILDISLDISYGMRYLHSHVPSIIHRDISAKNILIGGSRAKIADLGQAKIFGTSALSRQTSMPGAMAYSAPEVLTGKYSTKIDIFSLGVLLVQLVSGDYPRIEKREEQLATACSNFQGILSSLLTSCIDFIPFNRPDIAGVIDELEAVKANDRYYPPLRRLPPQSDVGILARKWMNDQMEETNREVRLALDLTSKQLAAEQQRWLEEASRVDELKRTLAEKDDALAVVSTADEEKEQIIVTLRQQIARLTSDLTGTMERLEKSEFDQHRVRERLKLVEVQHHLESVKLAKAEEAKKESDSKAEQLQKTFQLLQQGETKANEREKETKMYLDMQVEQNRELEARLEQALHRWKLEKETSTQETEKYIKMRSTCATLVEQLNQSTTDAAQLADRLGLYDNLPMPDEIRARMRDLSSDNEKLTENLEKQRQRHETLLNQHDLLENKVGEMSSEIEEITLRLQQKTEEFQEKSKLASSLTSRLGAATQEVSYSKRRINELEEENAQLLDNEAELSDKLRETEERLQLEVRRMQLRATVAAGGGGGMGDMSRGASRAGDRLPINKQTPISNQEVTDGDTDGGVNRGEGGEDSTAAGGKDSGKQSPNTTTTTATTANPISLDEFLANATEEEISAMEGRKRDRSERELKREVAHATAEGATGLITLLRANLDNEMLCWRVPRALRELAIKDEAARQQCVDEQCDGLLLTGMTGFPQSAVVQAQCLRLLGTLAFGNDQVRRSAGEHGVIRMILYAMQRHGDEDESVLLHACTALTNLMHNSLENRSRFLDHAGVDLLVRMMDAHKASATIQRQICWTILTLAGSDDASRAVVEAGGASAIVNAMVQHRNDPGVQQFGCWALGNLALSGDDNRRKLKKVGALEVSRMAIEHHADDTEVLRQARQLITVLGAK